MSLDTDIFDSRDIPAALEEAREDDDEQLVADIEALIEDIKDEPDYEYGMTLIADHYFEQYCEQLAEDIGYVGDGNPMSSYIDWERWANDCKMDYAAVEFQGTTFWYR